MEVQLQALLDRCKVLRRQLKSERTRLVGKVAYRQEAKAIGTEWHQSVRPALERNLSAEILDKYDHHFTRLVKLSAPSNQLSSYLSVLEGIIRPFGEDLLLPAQTGELSSKAKDDFGALFSSLDQEESDYLAEAIACARADYKRAAVVLGWSAAVDRIHRQIETIGFKHFNVVSAQMASQQTGRYKKFNQAQNVNSLSELRDVFDNIILWIIEGMTLIDSNQHTRLRACFDMRCQCAHPGDAPITVFNLLSFFSDLDQIIFQNPKFKVRN